MHNYLLGLRICMHYRKNRTITENTYLYQIPDLFGWELGGIVVGVVLLITIILITEYYSILKRIGRYLGINFILIFALPLYNQIQMYGFSYTMLGTLFYLCWLVSLY